MKFILLFCDIMLIGNVNEKCFLYLFVPWIFFTACGVSPLFNHNKAPQSKKDEQALLSTEEVILNFTPAGITRLARIAFEVNERTENIGARRLATVMERLLDDVSFTAHELKGQSVDIDEAYVDTRLADLSQNDDLSRFIL